MARQFTVVALWLLLLALYAHRGLAYVTSTTTAYVVVTTTTSLEVLRRLVRRGDGQPPDHHHDADRQVLLHTHGAPHRDLDVHQRGPGRRGGLAVRAGGLGRRVRARVRPGLRPAPGRRRRLYIPPPPSPTRVSGVPK
ncbi:hypothetical protein PG994_002475 [Apiospora phragmitis]|uniref:Secreted protein n=1 Tax=Apiospora phragmitis TaxID=2905665 RepID=A0ABR1WWG2_9PEZI